MPAWPTGERRGRRARDLESRERGVAAVVGLLPVLPVAASNVADDWVPSGDEAVIAVRVHDVLSTDPLWTGLPSTRTCTAPASARCTRARSSSTCSPCRSGPRSAARPAPRHRGHRGGLAADQRGWCSGGRPRRRPRGVGAAHVDHLVHRHRGAHRPDQLERGRVPPARRSRAGVGPAARRPPAAPAGGRNGHLRRAAAPGDGDPRGGGGAVARSGWWASCAGGGRVVQGAGAASAGSAGRCC